LSHEIPAVWLTQAQIQPGVTRLMPKSLYAGHEVCERTPVNSLTKVRSPLIATQVKPRTRVVVSPPTRQVPAPPASGYAVNGQSELQRRLGAARRAIEDRKVLRELGLLDP
jgi:hypothetical protein